MSQVRIKQHAVPVAPLSPSQYHGKKQQAKPLTHHEILTLIAPFTKRGWQADLSASDRAERKLAFKPIAHAAQGEGEPALLEALMLDGDGSKGFRLIRTVSIDESASAPGSAEAVGSPASTLTVEGTEIDALLDRAESVPVRRQIKLYAGIPLARSYIIDAETTGGPKFVEAKARVHGVTIVAQADRKRGMPVDLKFTADPGEELRLPEDLIAVLGWRFRPLVHIISYWRGTIKVARREPERTPDIEHSLGRVVTHLQRTLEDAPAAFHRRYRRARWRVTFQRAIPMLLGLGLLAATPAIRFLDLSENSILRMLIFHAPPIMLVGFFMMREMPRIEIPPMPRPLVNRAWIFPAANAKPLPSAADSGAFSNRGGKTDARPLEAES